MKLARIANLLIPRAIVIPSRWMRVFTTCGTTHRHPQPKPPVECNRMNVVDQTGPHRAAGATVLSPMLQGGEAQPRNSRPSYNEGAAKPQEKPMAHSPLSEVEISTRLASVPKWNEQGGEIVRTFEFKDFRASLAFVNKVGDLAETAGHHPDIDIRYNKVRLALVSHDAGGLTVKDFDLAAKIDTAGA
jgi:4a-hydroxytetrahydrobiopterin dehydratase